MSKPFIHLHVHTEMSLLDGATRITKGKKSPLFDACKEKNMPAIAITDHGNMYGVFTFQKMAEARGIKPILGCELYICDDMHNKTDKCYEHILLLAKNDIGYKNLVKLDSIAYTEGFYYKPRIDWDFLREHAEGLICTTACIGGTVPQLLLNGDYEKAKEKALMMKEMFAEGDFYIELQNHGIPEEKQVLEPLYRMSREIGVKVVATNDVHYLEKEDAEAHDVLLCIQTGKDYNDPKRMRFDGNEFYLKTYEEMEKIFAWCPEALETPFEIADKCNARIVKQNLIPAYYPKDGSDPADFLRRLTQEGLKSRYAEITPEIEERTEYELDTIISLGYAEYYLIVWDFIDYAKQNDIPVGAGRGSGVGSIVAYAVGITNVDPLKYNLLFERFLNKERVSMPDFDIDFCVEGRGKVIEYVVEKYGSDKVCQILALGTMAAKNAIKDVARVFKIPLQEVNALTKMIPGGKVHIEEILGLDDKKQGIIPEVLQAYQEDESMRKVLDLAIKLEGMPRNCSKHAAGVVICREVISDFVPLSKSGDDVTTQFQKEEVEEVGMLKMDFLGLRTLTDIAKAKQYIFETTGNVVDFAKIGYSDKKAFELISSGETDAVFQLESGGMKNFMKNLQPQTLEDIIAGISLFRPGPMDSIPQYVESKNFPEKIAYDHESLEPILNMTYGCIVYQEQVMQIVQRLAGYTLGGADILRRIMSKKKADEMEKQRLIFLNGDTEKAAVYDDDGKIKKPYVPAVDGALKRGVPEEAANIIFDKMSAFAAYAFNKSHAAAYAVVAYETAYLKAYYPVQFIAAVINNRITNADEVAKYVEYMRESGVEILPPDVNMSGVYFSCEKDALRFGLMGVKNVGEAAIKAIVNEREQNGKFKSLTDLIKRADNTGFNKRLLESLIKAGALDCFGHTRTTLIGNYESVMTSNSYDKKLKAKGQMSLFDLVDMEETEELIPLAEKPKNDMLLDEKEVMNVYLSGHPLDEYREMYSGMPFNLSLIKPILASEKAGFDEADSEDNAGDEVSDLIKKYDKKYVEIGGMLGDIRIKVTKSNKSMCMAKIEDLHSNIEVVIFPNTYDRYRALVVKDSIVRIKGELQVAGGRSQIVAKDIFSWRLETADDEVVKKVEEPLAVDNVIAQEDTQEVEPQPQAIYINGNNTDDEELHNILEVLEDMRSGGVPCYIQRDGKMLNPRISVLWCSSTRWSLSNIVGVNNYKIKE